MKAFIYRNGHEADAAFVGVDPAGNVCAIATTMNGAIEEAGLFSVYHHRQKVSIELVSEGKNKKFEAAQAALDDKISRQEDCLLLEQMRAAEKRGELGPLVVFANERQRIEHAMEILRGQLELLDRLEAAA